MQQRPSSTAAALWALIGVGALFTNAALRLGARGVSVMRTGLTPLEWGILAALTVIFVYGEGVRALQRAYIPRLIERVRELRTERSVPLRLAAPLYAMALVGAPGRTLLRAWAGVSAIVLAVLLVRAFPDPWRGIVDFAVAAALAWATLALAAAAPRALR
ncbi:MAG: hypothetical protein WEA24_08775 [Gemmatimonadota bacterium]